MTIFYDYLVSPQEIDLLFENIRVTSEFEVDSNTFGVGLSSGLSVEFDFEYLGGTSITLTDMRVYSDNNTHLLDVSGLDIVITDASTSDEILSALLAQDFQISLTSGNDVLSVDPDEGGFYDFSNSNLSVVLDGGAGYDAIIAEGVYLDMLYDPNDITYISEAVIEEETLSLTYENGDQIVVSFAEDQIVWSGSDSVGTSFTFIRSADGSVVLGGATAGLSSEIRSFEAIVFEDFLFPIQDLIFTVDEESDFSYSFQSSLQQLGLDRGYTYSAQQPDGSALPAWLSIDPVTGLLSGVPGNSDVGFYEVLINATTVSDAISTTTLLLVNNQNDAPTLLNALLDAVAVQDSEFVYQIADDTYLDVDAGDELTLTVTAADGGMLPTWLNYNAESRTLSGMPGIDDLGSIEIAVTATDASSASVTDTFILTIGDTMTTENPLDGLLAIRNGQVMARWNFPESIDFTVDDLAGLGTGVTLSYSFLSAVPAYYSDGSIENLTVPSDFSTFESEHQAAVESVLDYYSSVINVTFVEESQASEGQMTFGFSEQDPGTAGRAFYPNFIRYSNPETGIISAVEESLESGDIWLQPAAEWDTGDFEVGGEGYNTLLHEIGHALGLKHPFEEPNQLYQLSTELDHTGYTVMAYEDAPNSTILDAQVEQETIGTQINYYYSWSYSAQQTDTLMVGDITALQHLYGANTATNNGNDSYSWDANEFFFETIWDGGGIDTLDCSNQTYGCEIDLTPGSYSSIALRSTQGDVLSALGYGGDEYDWIPGKVESEVLNGLYNGSNNLAIAENTLIENVVGGSGDDQIIGNSADNQINGGAGVDTAIYSGNYADYTFNELGSGWSIYSAMEGTDTLLGIESLQFSDQLVSVDQLVTSTGGGDSISGVVNYWGSTIAMEGVMLTLTETGESVGDEVTTTSDGSFEFTDLDLSSGATLQAEKTVTDSSAVNLQDAILVLKQIVGLETLNGYQEIAADLDQNGSADLNDAIGILKHVVGLPTTDPEWLFVETSETPTVGSSIDIASDHTGEINLVGVLRGDVDGGWEEFS